MNEFDYPAGATALEPDEIKGLLLTHITTRQQLDRWEQENINEAIEWVEKSKPTNIFNESFVKKLHKKMFGNVWAWAGKFRQTEKNIGVAWYHISIELKKLFDDAEYWIANKVFEEDELAARFHHRLVSIHSFANGNGRHSRLMTDILMENILGKERSKWGGASLAAAGEDRTKYIESLVAADRGDYRLLIDFVRN